MAAKVARLEAERERLLTAYYAGAVPLELLKREQSRITAELSTAEQRVAGAELQFDVVETNLEQALSLATNWHAAYLACGPRERRQMNQAIFERLYVHADETLEHVYQRPFALLLGDELPRAATERHLLTAQQSADIDEEWRQLAAKWADPFEPALQGAVMKDPQTDDPAGGLNLTLLVGAEGLEPPTPSL